MQALARPRSATPMSQRGVGNRNRSRRICADIGSVTCSRFCSSARPAAASPGDPLTNIASPAWRALALERDTDRHDADQRDGDGERTARGVAAHQRDAVFAAQVAGGARELREPGFVGSRHREREQSPRGLGTHGREIREIDRERAMTDGCRRRSSRGKCTPSTSVSVTTTSSREAGGMNTAPSSPTPMRTSARSAPRCAKYLPMSSNSDLGPWHCRP